MAIVVTTAAVPTPNSMAPNRCLNKIVLRLTFLGECCRLSDKGIIFVDYTASEETHSLVLLYHIPI